MAVFNLKINKKEVQVDVDPSTPMLWVLRDHLNLVGTKFGCGVAQCGACTILMDGESRLSCLMLAAQLEGREILTIEGVAANGACHAVQQAFVDHGAVQCGFCTPGMILATLDLLRRIPDPTREDVRRELSGNLCRCTGYQKIVDAVMAAARIVNGGMR